MDKYELRLIAKNDSDSEVRKAAVNKLSETDSSYELRLIAKNDSDSEVRKAAVNKLSETDSSYELRLIAKNDQDNKVREIARLKLSGKSIPHDLLKSSAELEREKNERLRILCIQAQKEGIDVCLDCLTIKPPRCLYCKGCINCRGGYSSICYYCDDDDD